MLRRLGEHSSIVRNKLVKVPGLINGASLWSTTTRRHLQTEFVTTVLNLHRYRRTTQNEEIYYPV